MVFGCLCCLVIGDFWLRLVLVSFGVVLWYCLFWIVGLLFCACFFLCFWGMAVHCTVVVEVFIVGGCLVVLLLVVIFIIWQVWVF